jgi:hypothetical protein
VDTFLGLKKRTGISSSMASREWGLDSYVEKIRFVTFCMGAAGDIRAAQVGRKAERPVPMMFSKKNLSL